jgi:predicted GIY-YIG superfamily endonuclease
MKLNTERINLKRKNPSKWTDELLKKSASKYKTVKEWRTKEESAYATASARGLLKELTSGMIKIGEKGYWTKEKVKNSALKYKTKVEWITNENPAYHAASKNKWIEELTKHMTPIGNKKMRCVYSISVVGKKIIYIGLTGYFERRIRDHFETQRIKSLIKEHGKSSIITKKLTKYILADEAIKIENKFIKSYRKKKYIVLNQAKAGSLGGTTVKWTKEKILNEAKKYPTIKDWLKKDKLSYSAAWSMNILNQATKHMVRLWEKKWTDEKVIKAALKFKSFKDWLEKDKNSYAAAQKRKLLNDPRITNYLKKVMGKTSKWTMVKVIKEAKKYKSRSVWKKNSPSSYRFAQRNGFFLNAVKHMKRPKPWNKIN